MVAMSLLGPIVVVGDHMSPDLVTTLGEAGAFPVVETPWENAPAAITKIEPAAVSVRVAEGVAVVRVSIACRKLGWGRLLAPPCKTGWLDVAFMLNCGSTLSGSALETIRFGK